MSPRTSQELEREFLDNLAFTTGWDLETWLAEIAKFGVKESVEIIRFLKEERGFGHIDAALLAGIYANGGKMVYAKADVEQLR